MIAVLSAPSTPEFRLLEGLARRMWRAGFSGSGRAYAISQRIVRLQGSMNDYRGLEHLSPARELAHWRAYLAADAYIRRES